MLHLTKKSNKTGKDWHKLQKEKGNYSFLSYEHAVVTRNPFLYNWVETSTSNKEVKKDEFFPRHFTAGHKY